MNNPKISGCAIADILMIDITDYGGPSSGTRRRIKYLAENGYSIYSIICQPKHNPTILPCSKNIHYKYLSDFYTKFPLFLTVFPYICYIFYLTIYLNKKHNVKVFHVHGIYDGLACCVAKLVVNISVHITLHGPPSYEILHCNSKKIELRWRFFVYFLKLIEMFVFRYSDNLMAVSEFEKYFVQQYFPRRKVTIIRNGIDINEYKPNRSNHEKIPYNRKIITFVGRLVEKNGPFILLQSIPIVVNKFKNAHFVFVGEGELENDLKKYVYDNNLNEFVTFLGWRHDIKEILNASDIFSSHCSSLVEGIGNNVIEALSCGLPCVVGKDSITQSIFKNHEDAILVDKDKPKEVASGLLYLLYNENESFKIARSARNLAIKEFSLDSQMKKLITTLCI